MFYWLLQVCFFNFQNVLNVPSVVRVLIKYEFRFCKVSQEQQQQEQEQQQQHLTNF